MIAHNLEYSSWDDMSIIADCFRELKMQEMAVEVLKAPQKIGIIQHYLSILEKTARKVKHMAVLERLSVSGFIYG